MTDERLRQLERKAKEGDEARRVLLRERVRAGKVPPEHLRLIEWLQPGAATREVDELLSTLEACGLEACLRAGLACMSRLRLEQAAHHAELQRVLAVVTDYVLCPTQEFVDQAAEVAFVAGPSILERWHRVGRTPEQVAAMDRVDALRGGGKDLAWAAGAEALRHHEGPGCPGPLRRAAMAVRPAFESLGDDGWPALRADLLPWLLQAGDPLREADAALGPG